ncbi:hypothetical protein HK405_014988, partial [Cladochytrium tenue]
SGRDQAKHRDERQACRSEGVIRATDAPTDPTPSEAKEAYMNAAVTAAAAAALPGPPPPPMTTMAAGSPVSSPLPPNPPPLSDDDLADHRQRALGVLAAVGRWRTAVGAVAAATRSLSDAIARLDDSHVSHQVRPAFRAGALQQQQQQQQVATSTAAAGADRDTPPLLVESASAVSSSKASSDSGASTGVWSLASGGGAGPAASDADVVAMGVFRHAVKANLAIAKSLKRL